MFPAQGKDSPRNKTLGLTGKRLSDPEAAKRRAPRCTETGNALHAKIQRSCHQEFQLQCLIVPEIGGKTHCQCFKRAWARGIRQEIS